MNRIEQLRCVARRKLQDLAHHPIICFAKSALRFGRYRIRRRSNYAEALNALLRAHCLLITGQRYEVPRSRLMTVVEKAIRREFSREGPGHAGLTQKAEVSDAALQTLQKRGGIVLKPPRFETGRTVEKGVLLLKFGQNFVTFCRHVDVAAVVRDYVIVLEPGWSGLAVPEILYFARFSADPVIVMAAEKRDYRFLERLDSNLIPVRYACGDWVDHAIFTPLQGREKKYDAVMVSSWLGFKRHHALFRALRDMDDPTFRVAMASHMPRNRDEIESLIEAYGVRENLVIFERLSPMELNEILSQSKVNLLLSLQEGGNKSLFEGFFAGVPGLALANNVGLPKDYFTPETGRLIREKDLPSQLLHFREYWKDYNPRPWALAHIAPEVTIAQLNGLLRELALQRGEQWTQDLVAKSNSPNLVYYPRASAPAGYPSMEDIVTRYHLPG